VVAVGWVLVIWGAPCVQVVGMLLSKHGVGFVSEYMVVLLLVTDLLWSVEVEIVRVVNKTLTHGRICPPHYVLASSITSVHERQNMHMKNPRKKQ
jgi:hypothetical protein